MSTVPDAAPSASILPRPLTRFIGRQDEIEAILMLLMREDVRLVTLTGPGGIGKTRLSIEVAHRMEAEPDWGVSFVTLATVSGTDDAILRIAGSLGLWNSQSSDVISRLARLLEHQQILLVIDNLEHVIHLGTTAANAMIDPGAKHFRTLPVTVILPGHQPDPNHESSLSHRLLQDQLLTAFPHRREVIAGRSSDCIPIQRPDVVIDVIAHYLTASR